MNTAPIETDQELYARIDALLARHDAIKKRWGTKVYCWWSMGWIPYPTSIHDWLRRMGERPRFRLHVPMQQVRRGFGECSCGWETFWGWGGMLRHVAVLGAE